MRRASFALRNGPRRRHPPPDSNAWFARRRRPEPTSSCSRTNAPSDTAVEGTVHGGPRPVSGPGGPAAVLALLSAG
eukprot:1042668-Alexandrium_andersonii.AAC.1